MELQSIKVEGLYDTFDHLIEFKREEKITLLIGQNGLGKTVILRMLKSFFDQDFTELTSLYFNNFILSLEKRTKELEEALSNSYSKASNYYDDLK